MKNTKARIPTPEEALNSLKIKSSLEERPPDKSVHLTDRLKKLVILTIANLGQKSFEELCRVAGYKVGPNSKMSVLKKRVDAVIGERLAEINVFEIDIAEVLKGAMSATKLVPCGKVENEMVYKEVPDWAERRKTAELILKMGEAHYYNRSPLKIKGQIQHDHKLEAPRETLDLLKSRRREIEQAMTADYEVVDDERAA